MPQKEMRLSCVIRQGLAMNCKVVCERSNMRIDRVSMRSYLNKPNDAMTIDVRSASADGTLGGLKRG